MHRVGLSLPLRLTDLAQAQLDRQILAPRQLATLDRATEVCWVILAEQRRRHVETGSVEGTNLNDPLTVSKVGVIQVLAASDVGVGPRLQAKMSGDDQLQPGEHHPVIRDTEEDVTGPHYHSHVELSTTNEELERLGARNVLATAQLLIPVPHGDHSLASVWVPLQQLDDPDQLAGGARAVGSPQPTAVSVLAEHVATDRIQLGEVGDATEELNRLHGCDATVDLASGAQYVGVHRVLDPDGHVSDLPGRHATWRGPLTLDDQLLQQGEVGIGARLSENFHQRFP